MNGKGAFFAPAPVSIQPRLAIGQPGDKYEREADSMADRVVSQSAPAPVGASSPPPAIQAMCAECAEEQGVQRQAMEEEEPALQAQMSPLSPRLQRAEEEEPEVQTQLNPLSPRLQRAEEEEPEVQTQPLTRKAAGGQSFGTTALASRLSASRGGGQPMAPPTHAFMSSAFGRDFGQVRIHTGSEAVQMNQGLNARAFTHGSDIYFNRGQYNPESTDGKRLLAHELTHVVQQGEAIRRQPANPTQENVWGFIVNQSMCGCGSEVADGIANANHFSGEYRACNLPGNTTPDAIEDCVDARNPGSTVSGSTSSSGTVTVHTPASTPCERLMNRGTRVHEVFHSRQADRYARTVGGAFYSDWLTLRGDANRLDTLRSRYPAEAARYEALWENSQNWIDGEIESYTWERRFLVDARRALNRICP